MSISRKAMIEFLKNHFRYNTMNSWNAATSYAVKVKIHDFVPREFMDKAYDLIQVPETYYPINEILHEWDRGQGFQYQTGFNGRSGGYIVMYLGGKKPSEYKRVCQNCRQKNYRADSTTCGRCGSTNMHDYNGEVVFTLPGRSIDQRESFEEWTTEDIRDRYRLVRSFDQMVERAKKEFINLCRDFQVREKTVMVEKKIKVLEAV